MFKTRFVLSVKSIFVVCIDFSTSIALRVLFHIEHSTVEGIDI